MTKIFMLAAIVILTHGSASIQSDATMYSGGRNDSNFINISETKYINFTTLDPLLFGSMNFTECTCECNMTRNETLFMALIYGFIIGSLTAGTIASIFVLQIRLKELKERQENEDMIMNMIEWNDLRRKTRRIVIEKEVDSNIENNVENDLDQGNGEIV